MKIIIILIFYLQITYVYSQQDKLNETFYFTNDILTMTSIIPTDSGYVLAGMYYGQIAVCLVDSSAGLKWLKLFSDTTLGHTLQDVPDNFKKTSDGNYVACGLIQNGTASFSQIFLMKLDSQFNEIYVKKIIDESNCDGCLQGKNVFENNDHDYILLGASSRDSTGILNTGGFQDGLLFKTDTSGSILNHKLYSGTNNNHDWLNCGLQMGNNYYLFGGTYSYAPGGIVGMDRMDGWVVKTDLQGNEITSQNYGNPNILDNDFSYAIPIGGNKILTGRDKGIAIHSSGIRMYKPWLLLLNENLVIDKEFFLGEISINGDTLSQYGLTQTIICPDSSFTILGNYGVINTSNFQILLKRNTITHLNKDFKIEYFRKYKHSTNECPYEYSLVISNTADGGYVIGGYVNDNTLIPAQQAWLVKTDSLGCDGFHSCDDTLLVCTILQAPDTACKNDTAWLHVKFKGRSAPYFIYANNTLALDSIYYPYTLPLWIDTLVPYVPTTLGIQQVIIKVNDPWGWYQTDTVQVFVKNCGAGVLEEDWYPKKVEIYPNPASTEIRVRMRAGTKTENRDYIITLYNMQGIQVKQITTKSQEHVIDITDLPSGIYGIRVIGDKINCNERFVKL